MCIRLRTFIHLQISKCFVRCSYCRGRKADLPRSKFRKMFGGFCGGLAGGIFSGQYRCFPVSFIDKNEAETGNKIFLPSSALDRLGKMSYM